MDYDAFDDNTLKIGDVIHIKNLKTDCILFAEGILQEDVVVNNFLASFEDALFCIHLQRQYSAALELEKCDQMHPNASSSEDVAVAKYHHALQRGRSNEHKLNESYMKQKIGTPICFGDIIQLLHIKSGKYISIIPDQLARDERENIQVSLNPHGSAFSWLQLLPRYKIDREGDRILSNTEVVLKVAERPNEFIHCSEKPPPAGCLHEVNCSLESTPWRLSLFQSKVSSDSNVVLASQLVYLHDPETRCNVTVMSKKEAEGSESVDYVAIKPVASGESFDSNNLWVIETKKLTKGGPVRWRKDQIRLRNLNTGQYLCMTSTSPSHNVMAAHQSDDAGDDAGESSCTRDISLSLSPSVSGTLFHLHELYSSSSTHLTEGKAMQMAQGGHWIARGQFNNHTYSCFGSAERSKGVNLLVHRYAEGDEGSPEDLDKTRSDPLDVFVGVAARNFFKNICDQTVVLPPTSKIALNAIWPGASAQDLDTFINMVRRVISFINGFPISVVNHSSQAKPNDSLRLHRQKMICDQGALGIIMQLIEKLIPISAYANKAAVDLKSLTKTSKAKEMSGIKVGNQILESCLDFVLNAIIKNPHNQMFVADALSVLLCHVGSQPLASRCVTEMLSNNMELQESKIGSREISLFTEKLRNSSMNSMYLQLLQACCSCRGKGVVGNQFDVAKHFFEDHNDIVISVHCDDSRRQKVAWDKGKSGLYIPNFADKSTNHSNEVLGSSLITHGLPALSLSWTTRSVDFSPLGLFGKLSISFEELFQAPVQSKYENQTNTFVYEKRQAVVKYLSAEMSLVAEMCLERNYSAMQKAEQLFSYDVLVTLIKLGLDDDVQASAVRLLLHLYVDRNPQMVSCLPSLTRKFSAEGNHRVLIPAVEDTRTSVFALLQQLISENVREMNMNRWKEVSLSFMQLLNSLVMFSFYGSEDKLRDVIEPLVCALDRRNVIARAPQLSDSTVEKIPMLVRQQSSKKLNSNKIQSEVTVEAAFKEDSADIRGSADSWQAKTLQVLESWFVLTCVILLVVVAIGVTVLRTVTGSEASAYHIFELIVLSIFFSEISLRYYCFVFVNQSYFAFFSSFLNCVDVVVVLIDLALLAVPTSSDSGAQYTKSLRAIRLVRLVRIFRAARLVKKLTTVVDVANTWKVPSRYAATPPHELETMVAAMNVLASVQRIVEDRCVSLLLDGFHKWQNGLDSRSPEEIFEDVIVRCTEISLGLHSSFDDIFLDNIMFESSVLVQVDLDLLMAHHSLRGTLISNFQKVQLVVSPPAIEQLDRVRDMLQRLERNTEANEIWGHLRSREDELCDGETKCILRSLISLCKERRTVLEFDLDYQPVTTTQDLLRNLGFCELSIKMRRLLAGGNNKADSTIVKNNLEIFSICNQLMYWFLYDNNTNQNIAFRDIQFFFDTLDMNIGSHLVIQALFANNEDLMRSCPKKLVVEFTDKVCSAGQLPQYLTLHGAITNTRGKNIIENQFLIVKILISPARVQRLVSFFCPVTHPDYARKVALMQPFVGKKHVGVDDLPLELGYHLEFLRVLSGCTVGRSNLNTIEAKVQSLYDYVDMLDAILDPRSILIVKTRLTLFFFNAMIDVEVVIPEIAHSARMWRLLDSFEDVFDSALDDLKLIGQHGWEDSGVDRQNLDHMLACALVTGGFFQCLYDATQIRGETSGGGGGGGDRVQKTPADVNDLIGALYHKIKLILDFNSPVFAESQVADLEECLDGLNKSSGISLHHKETNELCEKQQEKTPGRGEEENEGAACVSSAPADQEDAAAQEVMLQKFKDFCRPLLESEALRTSLECEHLNFVCQIEKLPFLCENSSSDLQYEPLICKLVNHVRDRLELRGDEKRLDPRCTRTSKWIIRCLRSLVENKWGMTICERDDEGGEREDAASSQVVSALDSCGVTTLCLDMISVGIDHDLLLECVKLCVALLFKEGGNLMVQTTIFNHLDKTKSETFFLQIRSSIQKLVSWHEWGDVVTLDEGVLPELPEEIVVVRFLQLMCEGHFKPCQDLMREQPTNKISINLLDDFIVYLNAISRIPCRTSSTAAIQLAATVLEVIQGPCELNQEHFIMQTELMETLNRLLRAIPVGDCDAEEEGELKKTCVDIFQALLEGRGGDAALYERVLSVIHLDIINMLSAPVDTSSGQDSVALRTESLVLLQMLCDYKPSIRGELEQTSVGAMRGSAAGGGASSAAVAGGREVACVEVLWRGELQRRFFHVPQSCWNLAKPSKDAMVESVDRSSAENKLQDFLLRSHELYREIKHQQILKEWKVSGIFSRANQNAATWISFFLALVINLLLLSYYSAESGEPSLPPQVRIIADTLNLVQVFFSLFTLILFLVVRVPVQFQTNLEAGHSKVTTIFYTATDGLTMYYFIYLIICLLAFNLSDAFLTFLLLDVIVKNSTTRDVLNAVIYPRRQLGMTILLGVFVVYIFSFVIFYNFRDEMVEGDEKMDCDELFRCLLTLTGYGIRLETGIGEQMKHSLGSRYVIDNLFYFIIIIILLNVIFGIIIDTFSDLRTKKIKMQEDTTQRCFICGIDKNVFDRTIDHQQWGFKHHITEDHNMWNYLFFIIHIWDQDKDDDDGLEQYVRRCVDTDDIAFFPLNRAMRLCVAKSAGEGLRHDLLDNIGKTSDKLLSVIGQIEGNISEGLNAIAYSFVQDPLIQ